MTANSPSPKIPSPIPSRLAINYVAIHDLMPDPENARQHSGKQLRQIGKSIETFGFNVPVLIDSEFHVIAGHGRLLAVQRLGWREVPTIRLDHLTPAQRRAFAIADNRLAEVTTWDDRLLAAQLQALASADLDFDMEVIGFDMGEIDFRIESLTSKSAGNPEPPIPDAADPAASRLGDLWLLGRHRLLCGDARDPSAHATLLGSERAAVTFSDPPYNVPIDGHVLGLGKVSHREFPMASGEMTPEVFTSFLEASLAQMKRSSAPGAIAFICMDWRHLPELLSAARSTQFETLNFCVWTKPNAGMGSLYRSGHELVLVFKADSSPHRNNVQLGRHGRNRSNVWAYAAGPGFGRAGEEGRLAALHPTVKPTAMIVDAILDVSRRGDIVLDPFLGSGSTLMASERTGRRCYGIELDPLYCDVIVNRWQIHTGATARLATTGESFAAVAANRAAPAATGVRGEFAPSTAPASRSGADAAT